VRKKQPGTGSRVSRWRGLLILGAIALVTLGLFVAAPLAITHYDEAEHVDVDCQVISSLVTNGGSRSLRGIGSTRLQVQLETRECGTLIIRNGISDLNAESIASYFESGHNYNFELGEASFKLRDLARITNIATPVYGYSVA